MTTYTIANAERSASPLPFSLEEGARAAWRVRIESLSHYLELRVRDTPSGELEFMIEAGARSAPTDEDEDALPLALAGITDADLTPAGDDDAEHVLRAAVAPSRDAERLTHAVGRARRMLRGLPSPYRDLARPLQRRAWQLGVNILPPPPRGAIPLRD